jgi:hypothetical protein
MPVNALLLALVAELRAEDVPDPLNQRFTLAALWADLARLAGEAVPPAIVLALDDPVPLAPPVPVQRGSYADHRSQFPELALLPRGDLTITQILARCPHPTRR